MFGYQAFHRSVMGVVVIVRNEQAKFLQASDPAWQLLARRVREPVDQVAERAEKDCQPNDGRSA